MGIWTHEAAAQAMITEKGGGVPPDLDLRTKLASVRQLNSGMRLGAVGLPLWAGIMAGTLYSGVVPELGHVSHTELAAIFAVVLFQVVAVRIQRLCFDRAEDPESHADYWYRIYSYGSIRGTLAWAACLWLLWEPGNVQNHLFIASVAFGTPMLMIGIQASHRHAFTLGQIAFFAAMAVLFLREPEALNLVLLVLMLAWCGTALFAGESVNYFITSRQHLRFENEMLVENLKAASHHLKAAHEEAVRQREAAELANAAKSSFLAHMSHDLRTPLNAIIGFADLMKQRVGGPISPSKYAEYVDDIHRSGKHLLSLISDILDLAKIEAGKMELEWTDIDTAALAEEIVTILLPLAEKADVDLKTTVKAGGVLKADERALRRMIVNLLSNAIKFSPTGGEVRLCIEQDISGDLVVRVTDHGIGMDSADIAKVLEPFGQVGRHNTIEGEGTGLGLPITKSLVEAHGGTLEIESEQGIGTSVELRFPIALITATDPRPAQAV